MKKLALAVLSVSSLLGGCAEQLMSNGSLAVTTAALLGSQPSSLRISDRRTDGLTNTYYTATTDRGVAYRCTVNGGNLMTFGLANPPTCSRD